MEKSDFRLMCEIMLGPRPLHTYMGYICRELCCGRMKAHVHVGFYIYTYIYVLCSYTHINTFISYSVVFVFLSFFDPQKQTMSSFVALLYSYIYLPHTHTEVCIAPKQTNIQRLYETRSQGRPTYF